MQVVSPHGAPDRHILCNNVSVILNSLGVPLGEKKKDSLVGGVDDGKKAGKNSH